MQGDLDTDVGLIPMDRIRKLMAASREQLLQRLEAIDALIARPGSKGEQEAAQEARKRLVHRLNEDYGEQAKQPEQPKPTELPFWHKPFRRQEPAKNFSVKLGPYEVLWNFMQELRSDSYVLLKVRGKGVAKWNRSEIDDLRRAGLWLSGDKFAQSVIKYAQNVLGY